jgi:DNA-binding response OmpR family regulator
MSGKILVVEDNPDTRILLHFYLTARQFQVVTASNGLEGQYLSKAEKPDLIITDCDMPDGDACQLISYVRSQQTTSAIPIVVFTAFGEKMGNAALEAGANRAFYKPKDLTNLLHYVQNLF